MRRYGRRIDIVPVVEIFVEYNKCFSYYLYGNDGHRVAKLTGSAFSLGTGFATNALLDNYTLYPSEYLVITQQGYTKYYYANGTRIASRLGSGGFEKMSRLCTLDQNLTYNASALFNSVVARVGEDMPDYHISDPCPNYYSDIAGFRVPLPTLNFEPNFMAVSTDLNKLEYRCHRYDANGYEETYYFHGNHLGSANWITTATASPTQFLLHLPYGEEFVKQLSGSYDERFTFTGKEKDIETGYYYFGARFDNVDLGFMSVDPMADKYPSMSPYAYCAWNPIKLVDPEGEDWYDDETVKYVDELKKGIQDALNNQCTDEQRHELKNALDELTELYKSDQKYRIRFGGFHSRYSGETVFNTDDNCVDVIYYGKYEDFKIAHELKHAYQFEVGELSFGKNGTWGKLYDLTDEIAAHNRGAALKKVKPESEQWIKDFYFFEKPDGGNVYIFRSEVPWGAPKNSEALGNQWDKHSSTDDKKNAEYLSNDIYRRYVPPDNRFK